MYEEESESKPELEQEEDKEFENKVEEEPDIKKTKRKAAMAGNIFDYMNKNAKRHKQ